MNAFRMCYVSDECEDFVATDHCNDSRDTVNIGRDFPDCFPLNITAIYLCGMGLEEISPTAFDNCTSVETISLANNRLTTIHPFPPHLESLKYLDLQNNKLNFSTLESDLFSSLSALEVLNISHNQMWLTSSDYGGDIFSPLKALHTLVMDSLPGGIPFPQYFSNMASLEHLKLLASMSDVTNSTFAVFSELKIRTLTIWSGYLENIEPSAFAHFAHLEELDLSYNPKLGFLRVSRAWYGLRYTNISKLVLKYITRFQTKVTTIEKEFFHGLEHTNITELVLEGNSIVAVAPCFHCYLLELLKLSVSRNRLLDLQSLMDDLGYLQNLVHLDVRFQSQRSYITEDELLSLGYDPMMEQVDAAVRSIEVRQHDIFYKNSISKEFPGTEYDEYTEIDLGALRSSNLHNRCCLGINRSSDMTKPFEFAVSRTLQTLRLSGSLPVELESFGSIGITLHNGVSLKHLDYANNGLRRLSSSTIYLVNQSDNLLTLDLSYNNISEINGGITNSEGSIGNLLLRANRLGSNDLIQELNLASFVNLSTLDLSRNGITSESLRCDTLSENVRLTKLVLSDNALKTIPTGLFKGLHQLRYIDLSNNVLNHLTTGVCEELEDIADISMSLNSTLQISLKGNPLECSCRTRDFLEWVSKVNQSSSGIELLDLNEYQCWHDGELKNWNVLSLDSIRNDLALQCTWRLAIAVALPCAFAITLAIVCAVWCKRHKWDIKFWFLNNVRRRKRAREAEIVQNEMFLFDAFVAYDIKDVSWVKYELLPAIEGAAGLKVCVHHRDFMPGALIEENILQSIESSRKTILVISEHFLQSNWCRFETEMASLHSIEGGRDIVVPVLLEKLGTLMHRDLSIVMRRLLQRRTYLEWPVGGCQADKSLFWERLVRAVRTTYETLLCDCGRVLEESEV